MFTENSRSNNGGRGKIIIFEIEIVKINFFFRLKTLRFVKYDDNAIS